VLTIAPPFVSLSLSSPFALWCSGLLLILIVHLLSVVFLTLALYTPLLSKLIVVIDVFGYLAGGASTVPMEMKDFPLIP
jgi:hypothetical protein